MKFVQRDPGAAAEASSGGGLPGFAREALKLLVLGTLLFAAIYFGVGLVTDWILGRLSFEREEALFAPSEWKEVEPDLPAKYEASWQMAQHALQRLEQDPEVPRMTFHLACLPKSQPNAFAIPGGTIAHTEGLLETLKGG